MGDEFFGQELVCSDSRLWDCKEVGNVRAILKTEPKGAWGGVKLLDASSICIEHSLTIGGDLLPFHIAEVQGGVRNSSPGIYCFL